MTPPVQLPVFGQAPDYRGHCSSCRHRENGLSLDTESGYGAKFEFRPTYLCKKVAPIDDSYHSCADVNPNDQCKVWQAKRFAFLGNWFRRLPFVSYFD